MPAAAVANLTPSMGGMSGNCAGASGEIGIAKALFCGQLRWHHHIFLPGRHPISGLSESRVLKCQKSAALQPTLVRRARPRSMDSGLTALRPRRGMTPRRSILVLLARLVETLDFGGLPQLRDELGLSLARQKGLDLSFHCFELRRLFGAFVLDLDDMPTELCLHR